MDVISSNIANDENTRKVEGGQYRRRAVVFQPGQGTSPFHAMLARFRQNSEQLSVVDGVRVSNIVVDGTPGRQVLDPSHPDANAEGFVTYPNVDTLTEMTDLISASRAYEANVTVANALKSMAVKALDIGRV